jgi:hypothetical protein
MSTLRKVSDAGKSTIRPQSKLSTTAFRKHFEKALDKVRFEGRRIVLVKFDGCCAAVPMTERVSPAPSRASSCSVFVAGWIAGDGHSGDTIAAMLWREHKVEASQGSGCGRRRVGVRRGFPGRRRPSRSPARPPRRGYLSSAARLRRRAALARAPGRPRRLPHGGAGLRPAAARETGTWPFAARFYG